MIISKKSIGATPNKDFTDFFISKLSSYHQSSSTFRKNMLIICKSKLQSVSKTMESKNESVI